MTIKLGDKVRIVSIYSGYNDRVGIVWGLVAKKVRICFDDGDYILVDEEELELAEVAHYVPVPKFKVGDVVYDKNGKKYLILKEREHDLCYHCWAYANDTDVVMLEEELKMKGVENK